MRPPFSVIDADGHINEPETRLIEFLDPPYRSYLHAWVPDPKGRVNPNPAKPEPNRVR